jgi:hypothetical protein
VISGFVSSIYCELKESSLDTVWTGKNYKYGKLLKLKGINNGNFFLSILPIKPMRRKSGIHPIMEAFMAKTLALFFVLGLMVSCASHHHDRSISSVDKAEAEAGFRRYEMRGGSYER